MTREKIVFLFLILFTSLIGCVKEKFDPDILSKSYSDDITVATPIGYVKVPFIELFEPQIDSGILIQEADGLLRFRFQEGLYTLNASDLIQFPQFDSVYSIINNTGSSIDLNTAVNPVQVSQSFNLDFGYSQGRNNEQIDSIILDNMDMDVNVSASGVLNATLVANYPGIRYNSLSYSKSLVVSSSNTYSDLMAYTVHLQNSGIHKNQLQVKFTVNMNKTSRIIAPGEKIMDVYVRFSNLDFKALFGYIGQININPTVIAQQNINLVNERVNGYFNFDHARFELVSRNSFGVPFMFKLNSLTYRTYYIPTNTMIFENTKTPSHGSNLPFPNLSQLGQTIEGNSSMDTSLIQLAFQDYYSTISSSIQGQSNPGGMQDYNFVLDNSLLEISSSFSIPFWGYTDHFYTSDTINFPLSGFFTQTYSDINRLLFVINFTNALPMNAQTQIYFCNAGGNRLDSMFSTPYTITGSSNADGIGKVSPDPNNPVKVEFLAARLSSIQETRYLLVQSRIKTVNVQNSPPVSWKFFNDYYFYTHIGVAATLNQ